MAQRSVSVVIPVFNCERFLAEAIESVLAQTRPALDVIVVDDGSTDGSAAVAERFGEVRLIRTANRGPAAARNLGVAESYGELITFLDADDAMKPDRLERQAGALEENPETSFGLGRAELVSEGGNEPPAWLHADTLEVEGYYQMSLMVPRVVFERIGPFDEELRLGEDTDWLFRAFEAGLKPALVAEPVVVRRYHGGNATYNAEAVRAARFLVLKKRAARRRAAAASGAPQESAVPETVMLGVPDVSSHGGGRETP